jgi:hypothetical protein
MIVVPRNLMGPIEPSEEEDLFDSSTGNSASVLMRKKAESNPNMVINS